MVAGSPIEVIVETRGCPVSSDALATCEAANTGTLVQAAARRGTSWQASTGAWNPAYLASASVPSMTMTNTADVSKAPGRALAPIGAGRQVVRVAMSSRGNTGALLVRGHGRQTSVVGDAYFHPRYVFSAINTGRVGARVSPRDTTRLVDQIAKVAAVAAPATAPAQVGINAGSHMVAICTRRAERTGYTTRVGLSALLTEGFRVGLSILQVLGLNPPARRLPVREV
jgi:4-hydroxy-3-methylbut-2-en-1-yl diphosphate synthase IspG/GcpE